MSEKKKATPSKAAPKSGEPPVLPLDAAQKKTMKKTAPTNAPGAKAAKHPASAKRDRAAKQTEPAKADKAVKTEKAQTGKAEKLPKETGATGAKATEPKATVALPKQKPAAPGKALQEEAAMEKQPAAKKPLKEKKTAQRPVRVLISASECVPFIKTGGLADVVGALPRELKKQGADVRVILPEYSAIPWEYHQEWKLAAEFTVDMGWRKQYCGIHELTREGVVYYFVDNKQYFGRDYIYGSFTSEEGERFAFFAKAVLEAMRHLDFYPDILHANDWQAGMSIALLRLQYGLLPGYRDIRTVFTIHNLRYQGVFPWEPMADLLDLSWEHFREDELEYYGCTNFMKNALVFADAITTVSPTYAQEIRSAYYGETLDGMLRARSNALTGILNGLDVEAWDPATDSHIERTYTADDLSGKAECRAALQREFNLEQDPNKPIVAMVTRLTEQKGLDLVERVINEIADSGVQLAVLGRGDSRYESMLSWATWRYPGKVGARFEMSEALAHRVYAGADMFLMPSAFEPCGLSQMIAMRYGTVPVARETGGIKDTVLPYNKFTDTGLGFTFANYNAHEMLDALYRAIGLFSLRDAWARMVRRDMAADFRWDLSAKQYMQLYESLRS